MKGHSAEEHRSVQESPPDVATGPAARTGGWTAKRYVRWTLTAALVVVLVSAAAYGYWVQFDYRFSTVSAGKVYRSRAIDPEKLGVYVQKYGLRSVVDLRTPTRDEPENPGTSPEIERERVALERLGVKHYHIPSKQVPQDETVDEFLRVMEDPANYPVLIHCHHGVGRAVLFSALYHIEFEGWDNERARADTRFIVAGSSFDETKGKGRYLKEYVPRRK